VLCASQEIGSETTCIVLNWIIQGVLVALRLGHQTFNQAVAQSSHLVGQLSLPSLRGR